MNFENIVMMFTMQEPYYGILLSSMERIENRSIPTIGVCRTGNVFKLLYNPDFVNQFNVQTIMQLLKHECLHVAFNHFMLWDGTRAHENEQMEKLRNYAEDLEINCYLNRGAMQKEAGGLWVEDFGFQKNLGSREYFSLLLQRGQQQENAKKPQKPCNGGQGGQGGQSQQGKQTSQNGNSQGQNPGHGQDQSQPGMPSSNIPTQSELKKANDYAESKGKPFDDHTKWPEMSESEMENLKQGIEELLVFAAEEVEKGRGTIPGELVGRITALREKKKPKPVADWKRYFRRYIGNEFSELIRKSKKRESRRFPDAAGNRHKRKSHILVAIDTSGSVSMPEYREFFGQISTLRSGATFHVVECDAEIQHEYDYISRPNEKLHGGGGTSFQPPIDLFNQNKRKYDALIYFTDGGAPIPRNTPQECIWVISSKGDQSDRKRYKVNGAKVAFIPQRENS